MNDDADRSDAQPSGLFPISDKDRSMTVETINQISAIERTRRHHEVDFARGSVRHEGGILSDEIEQLNARYIAGEIDSDGLTGAILASQSVQLP
jgi:hypothetical protein